MDDPFWIYEAFNRLEAVAWFAIAIALPFRVRRSNRRQTFSVMIAVPALIAFGITDLYEASTRGELSGRLWAAKIACAAVLLSCRYTCIGWRSFRLTDKYLLFAILCLIASIGVLLMPRIVEWLLAG